VSYPLDDVQHVVGFSGLKGNNGVQTRNQSITGEERDEIKHPPKAIHMDYISGISQMPWSVL
jgi:hypothetical protein